MSENEYPEVHERIWTKRVGIDPYYSTCIKCKKEILLNVPIRCGEYEGWTSNHLECGVEYRQFAARIKDPKFIEAVNGIMDHLSKPRKPRKKKRRLKLVRGKKCT